MKERNKLFSVIVKLEKKHIIKMNKLFTYKVKIIKYEQDFVQIKLNETDLPLLDQANIPYKIISLLGLKHFIQLAKKNISIVIGIVIFTLLIHFNTLTIKEISFSTYTKDNQKIEDLIRSNFKSYYSVDFLETDINEINLMLRKEFSHFEWISVQRNGSNLQVNILEPSIINKQVEFIDGHGDLIASKSGVIKFFKVSHGVPLIDENMYVKQGDLLVSGNLRVKDPSQSEYYIPASGKVYAEVWDTITIEVPKRVVDSQLTGKLFVEKSLSVFGIDMTYKKYDERYDNFDVKESFDKLTIFNYKLPFGLKNIQYLEKDDIINVYNQKTSYDFAYSSVFYEVTKEFDQDDKLLSINLVADNEDEEKFTYVFFVKTYEDIAFFQRR